MQHFRCTLCDLISPLLGVYAADYLRFDMQEEALSGIYQEYIVISVCAWFL